MVGTRVAKGVPLPVVKRTIWAPDTCQGRGRYQIITRSGQQVKALLPDAFAVLQHTALGEEPDFWVQPRDLSSRVEIPPFLLPGDGFHR